MTVTKREQHLIDELTQWETKAEAVLSKNRRDGTKYQVLIPASRLLSMVRQIKQRVLNE